MQIVTGSFVDFEEAARGASALVAEGFGHGDVSIIARPASAPAVPTIALVAGALGALVVPGSVFAWAADLSALFAVAPSFGALAGACLGAAAATFADRRARGRAEDVRVVVDEPRARHAEAILRASGATLSRRAFMPRQSGARPHPPCLVPYRP